MTERRYDPADDSVKSYNAAVAAKRARGDKHWPARTERDADPETEKQMKRLKRALDKRMRQGGDNG